MFTTQNDLDLFSVVWFVFVWLGYSLFSEAKGRKVNCLKGVRNSYIQRWMTSICHRDIRISDATLFTILERNVAFCASTSLFVLVGLLSALVNLESIAATFKQMSFFQHSSLDVLAAKLLLLVAVYIYAVFTFTWSMRQYNFVIMMVGAAPLDDASDELRTAYAKDVAGVLSLASNTFNHGLRSYYFSLAVLFWFVHAFAFIGLTFGVVCILYRREFASKTLRAMSFNQRSYQQSLR